MSDYDEAVKRHEAYVAQRASERASPRVPTEKERISEARETKLEWEQISAREVPGFNVRTQCDDMIGKLWALRQQLNVDRADELAGMLDDIDAMIEGAVEVGFDTDAKKVYGSTVEVETALPERVRRYGGGKLAASGSKDPVYECSCGQVCL